MVDRVRRETSGSLHRWGVATVTHGTVGVGLAAVGIAGAGTACLVLLAGWDFLPIAVGVPMTIGDQHPTTTGGEKHEQNESCEKKRFHLTLMTFPS